MDNGQEKNTTPPRITKPWDMEDMDKIWLILFVVAAVALIFSCVTLPFLPEGSNRALIFILVGLVSCFLIVAFLLYTIVNALTMAGEALKRRKNESAQKKVRRSSFKGAPIFF